MGVLSRFRFTRANTDEGSAAPVPSPRRRAVPSPKHLAAAAEAAHKAIGDLKNLEQRYGAGVTPAAVRLRNAVLMHRAGRKDEAMAAFDQLLADPSLGGSPLVRPIIQSEIYSRMRIGLEREGCHAAAVAPAVLSYATRARFYALQSRDAELRFLRSADCFDRHFSPLLARARIEGHLSELRKVTERHLATLPELDVAALQQAVEALVHTPLQTKDRPRG